MKEFDLFGFKVEIDEVATKEWYDKANEWGCECGDCRHFVALAKRRKLPPAVIEILEQFGIAPQKATYVCRMDMEEHEYASDNDLPIVKEKNKILMMNLCQIAIIGQAAILNVAMRPFQEMRDAGMIKAEFLSKFIPLMVFSVWMAFNLRYEKDAKQYKKNVKIELIYCMVQAAIFLFGYYNKIYWAGTLLLITVALIYILWVNPKYMNRRMTK